MLVTEEEAKTKECCMSMAAEPNAPCLCRASDCMAWRWALQSDNKGVVQHIADENGDPVGYCGMAGIAEDRAPMKVEK